MRYRGTGQSSPPRYFLFKSFEAKGVNKILFSIYLYIKYFSDTRIFRLFTLCVMFLVYVYVYAISAKFEETDTSKYLTGKLGKVQNTPAV